MLTKNVNGISSFIEFTSDDTPAIFICRMINVNPPLDTEA